jgi:two-component system response regulator RegX3
MNKRPRLLLIEDEEPIRVGLTDLFVFHGFEVQSAADGPTGLKLALSGTFDLILLDVMLPGLNGFDICDRVRVVDRAQPIILLTALGADEDIIRGLKLGADDYVTKPFSPLELIARIRAVLRRRAPHLAGDAVNIGPLCLDPASHTVTCAGRTITLGPSEFDLLQYLMHNPERALTRDQLLNALRGDHRFLEDRTIDVYIRRLRAALGSEGEAMIQTIRGIGYKLSGKTE